jgi:hypothetical protein
MKVKHTNIMQVGNIYISKYGEKVCVVSLSYNSVLCVQYKYTHDEAGFIYSTVIDDFKLRFTPRRSLNQIIL